MTAYVCVRHRSKHHWQYQEQRIGSNKQQYEVSLQAALLPSNDSYHSSYKIAISKCLSRPIMH